MKKRYQSDQCKAKRQWKRHERLMPLNHWCWLSHSLVLIFFDSIEHADDSRSVAKKQNHVMKGRAKREHETLFLKRGSSLFFFLLLMLHLFFSWSLLCHLVVHDPRFTKSKPPFNVIIMGITSWSPPKDSMYPSLCVLTWISNSVATKSLTSVTSDIVCWWSFSLTSF